MARPVELAEPKATRMDCPVCAVDLVVSERLGIEIDYCPKCRGVWLDRGELDKIIERSMTEAPQAAAAPVQTGTPAAPPSGYATDDRGGYFDDRGSHGGGHRSSHGGSHGGGHGRSSGSGRHRSFLGRLFD